MKFLADENFPLRAVDALRQEGFDVSSIREIQPGTSDERDLALQHRLPAEYGMLLFRLIPQDPDEIARLALGALRDRVDWNGCFAVITRKSIRTRTLKR